MSLFWSEGMSDEGKGKESGEADGPDSKMGKESFGKKWEVT